MGLLDDFSSPKYGLVVVSSSFFFVNFPHRVAMIHDTTREKCAHLQKQEQLLHAIPLRYDAGATNKTEDEQSASDEGASAENLQGGLPKLAFAGPMARADIFFVFVTPI